MTGGDGADSADSADRGRRGGRDALTAHVVGVSVSGSRPTAREKAEVATADAEAVTL